MTHITPEQIETIIQQLWHNHEQLGEPIVYALLDGARNKKIHPLLDESGHAFSCLIEGKLDYGMTLASPYMMRLQKDADFTRTLIQHAWGNSWGLFAITYKPATLIKVRNHCKDILHVQDEETGRKLFFRYYDPRVLRIFLPTYTESDDLLELFGPIMSYTMENETATGLIQFTLKKEGEVFKLQNEEILLFDEDTLTTPLSTQ